jgi:hypothetical protein
VKRTWDQRASSFARRYLPPAASKLGKRAAVHLRYRQQLRAARGGFAERGGTYPHPIVFIAGLPKSGTTWLKNMVAGYPGFHEVMLPEVASYELATGGSHDYELPADVFSRLGNALAVMKMHVHGSPHNAALLEKHEIPYIVLYRDLRDVAISYFFYVRQTPWHPDFRRFESLDLAQGLLRFADYPLREYVGWIESWRCNADPRLGLTLRYEDLLRDTAAWLGRVANHFGLDASADTIDRIVAANDFSAMSGGRGRGEENQDSFFRKGVSGEWRRRFPADVLAHYQSIIGDYMADLGYDT